MIENKFSKFVNTIDNPHNPYKVVKNETGYSVVYNGTVCYNTETIEEARRVCIELFAQCLYALPHDMVDEFIDRVSGQ